jgi:hypothetical protein
MTNKMAVEAALNRAWRFEKSPELTPDKTAINKSSVISQLIFDIFGGEILKTHKRRGWHFYNRINGERIDFTKPAVKLISPDELFEDIPASISEIHNFFEQEQYLPFYMRFIREFEETVGLGDRRLLSA